MAQLASLVVARLPSTTAPPVVGPDAEAEALLQEVGAFVAAVKSGATIGAGGGATHVVTNTPADLALFLAPSYPGARVEPADGSYYWSVNPITGRLEYHCDGGSVVVATGTDALGTAPIDPPLEVSFRELMKTLPLP